MNQQNYTPEYPDTRYGYPVLQTMQDEKPINWRKYLFMFLSNWYWFMITIGIALSIAFFKIRYTIPVYESTATLIIEDDDGNQDLMSELRSVRFLRRRTDMANEVAKLSSFTMAKRTVEVLNQKVAWTAYGRIRERPIYENNRLKLEIVDDSVDWYKDQIWLIDIIDNNNYRFYQKEKIDTILQFNQEQNINSWPLILKNLSDEKGYQSYSFVVYNKLTLAKQYKSKLQIETDERDGTLIILKSRGQVGERETDYLNALCNSYISSGLERKQQIAENTIDFIDEQILVILDSLQKAEDQLLTFRLSNNVINLSREGELAYERLKGFMERKTQLKMQANYYSYLKNYVESRKDPQTVISPTLAEATEILLIGAIEELQILYQQRENLDVSVVENNPSILSINQRIESARLRILTMIDGLVDNNTLTLEQINTEEQAVIEQLKTLPINEQHLLNIKRKYDLYNQFYNFLLQKRAEAGIQKASTISNARILDPARYDQLVIVGNNKKTIILIALFFGIILPAIILILRVLLDNRIREREDIVNNTKIPLLGIIGHSETKDSVPHEENLNSSFTESLRRIRTNIQFLLRGPDEKVILITSSISGEGKTFVSTNLAAILAMNNKKVLLIGCDLRKPTLHRLFKVNNSIGLSSVIIGENSLEECIQETTIKNLFLLPSGPVPPNPAELLETDEMKKVFEKTRKEYDFIVLDTPPVALVSDSLSITEYVDITLYVIRQNYSHKEVINIVNQMENEERLPKLGLLINDMKPSKSLGYNYYYGYSQGYSYGYYKYSNYYSQE